MTDILSKIFPITLACTEQGWSSYAFQKTFRDAKPEGLTWYGYDTVIHSPTDIEFVAYDMECNFYGGLGKKIATFKTTVEPTLTAEAIENRIQLLAMERRAAELRAIEKAAIARYADEIRDAFALSSNQSKCK